MAVGIGSVIEVGIQMSMFSQRCLTVLHWLVQATPAQTDEILSQSAVAALLVAGGTADIITPYRQCCSNQLTFEKLTTQYVYPARFRKTFSDLGGVGGVSATAAHVSNTAGVIEKMGRLAGKKNRGAVHVPGFPVNTYDNGVLIPAQVTVMSALAAALKTTLAEAGGGPGRWVPVIHHRDNPLQDVLWDDYTIQNTMRTMRRRTVGVGI